MLLVANLLVQLFICTYCKRSPLVYNKFYSKYHVSHVLS